MSCCCSPHRKFQATMQCRTLGKQDSYTSADNDAPAVFFLSTCHWFAHSTLWISGMQLASSSSEICIFSQRLQACHTASLLRNAGSTLHFIGWVVFLLDRQIRCGSHWPRLVLETHLRRPRGLIRLSWAGEDLLYPTSTTNTEAQSVFPK